jgi:hypothetical protein
MVDPLAIAKGGLTTWRLARGVGNLLAAYLGKDFQALVELMREGDAAWVAEFCERLREDQKILEERLRQVHPLVTSLRWEAARDATDARRLMLACIAAFLLNSGESVENKARIERSVRDLDPADVALLGMLYSLHAEAAFATWEQHSRRSNLTVCVDVDYRPLAGFGGIGKPTLRLSETGRLVLNALQDFHHETLLAGFERIALSAKLDEWLSAEGQRASPFWVTRRATHPIRVLEVGAGPSIKGELFAWDAGTSAVSPLWAA